MKNKPAFSQLDIEVTEYRESYDDVGNEVMAEQVNTVVKGGLSKREYFAGLAMQGVISNTDILKTSGMACEKDIAQLAIKAADALLAELAKEVENEG